MVLYCSGWEGLTGMTIDICFGYVEYNRILNVLLLIEFNIVDEFTLEWGLEGERK